MSEPLLVIRAPKRRALVLAPCAVLLVVIVFALAPIEPGFPPRARAAPLVPASTLLEATPCLALPVLFVMALIAIWVFEERAQWVELYEHRLEVIYSSKIHVLPWGHVAGEAKLDDRSAAHVDLIASHWRVRIWTPGEKERAVVLELLARKGVARVER